MTLPAGVVTRTIRLQVPTDTLGTPPKVYVGEVKPDRTLVWAATGERLWPVGAKLPAVVDGEILFDVPIVDQAGWVDRNGTPITNWAYKITVRGSWDAKSQTTVRTFQVVDADPDPVDVELLPDGASLPVDLGDPYVASVAGHAGLVTGAQLVEALGGSLAVDPKASLVGGTLRIYGDSWAAGLGLGAGNSFGQKAGEDHGITTTNNLAVSGSAAQTIGTLMVAAGAWKWDEGDADLVVISAGINDARYNDLSLPANAKWLKSARNSLRVAAALALGQDRVHYSDASITYAGLWTPAAYNWSTNGTNVTSTLFPGSSASIAFEGDEITALIGGLITETQAVVDCYIDGEKVRTVRLYDEGVLYPASTANLGYRAERFTGLTPGPHVLKLVKADDTTNMVAFDSYVLPSDNPPLVVLVKEPTLPAATYADPAFAPYVNGNDASIKALQMMVDDVATEFPGVRLCELPVLTPVVDFQADGIHPNATGRDKLRAALNDVLDPPILPDRVDDLAGDARVLRAVDAPRSVAVFQAFTPVILATYEVPEGAVALRIRCLGGGGGGGSGRRGAAGSVRCGGGGGAGGGFADVMVSTLGLPKTLHYTVGPGGAGGAAVAVDDTSGNVGTVGTGSYVAVQNTALTTEDLFLAYAPGGNRGNGGTAAAGNGGGTVASREGLTGPGGPASTTGLAGNTTSTSAHGGCGQGGGAGGGISAANVAAAGGAGWWSNHFMTGVVAAPAAGAAGGGAGTAGAPANRLRGRLDSEASGAGGGANLAGAGGNGGAGGRGSGGGGGGASLNGNNSGAGGAGGGGFVEITAYF